MARHTYRMIGSLLAAAGAAGAAQHDGELTLPLLAVDAAADGWRQLEWDQAAYELLRDKGGHLTVPGFDLPAARPVELRLERFEVFTPDARFVIGHAHGEEETGPPDVVLLRGSVVGEPGSRVFIGLSPHGSNGYIQLANEMWIISTPPPHEDKPTVIYNPDALPEGSLHLKQTRCGNERLPSGGAVRPRPSRSAPAVPEGGSTDNECNVVRVAVDTDWEYTSTVFGGNTLASQAYAMTLLGAASEIYRNQLDVGLFVSYLRVWSSNADPYSANTVNDRIFEFQEHWSANMQSVERNIAHILTGLQSGGGGWGWLGVLCDPILGYAGSGQIRGSFPYPFQHHSTQNWDPSVVAHEIGHNFDAPHTHEIPQPPDRCGLGDCSNAFGATIMSYCHLCPGGMTNLRLEFNQRIIDEYMLPHLNTAACTIVQTPVAITSHPETQGSLAGRTVQFHVGSSGTTPRTFQWRHNGMNLNDGGRITGATTNQLRIANVQPSDNGAYTVVVSNACSSITSNAANLSVIQLCYANCDGSTTPPILNIMDFICFINHFSYAQTLPPAQQIQNYANCDQSTTEPILNIDDFTCFINKFSQGCP